MGKLFKVMALVCVVALAMPNAVFAQATVDQTWSLVIGVSYQGTTSLTIDTYTSPNGTQVSPDALTFSVTDITNATLPTGTTPATGSSGPWINAQQYLRVQYSSNYASWGVRIVTDNEDLEWVSGTTPVKYGTAGGSADANNTIDMIAGSDLTGGGTTFSYAGILDLDEIIKTAANQNPARRGSWAWSVYSAPQTAIPARPISYLDPASGALVDTTGSSTVVSVGDWSDEWTYIGDKNDTGYTDGISNVGGPYWHLIAALGSGSGGGSLAHHPIVGGTKASPSTKTGDGDIAIYVAAKFANNNYSGSTPTPFILAAGDYGSALYVELIHE